MFWITQSNFYRLKMHRSSEHTKKVSEWAASTEWYQLVGSVWRERSSPPQVPGLWDRDACTVISVFH